MTKKTSTIKNLLRRCPGFSVARDVAGAIRKNVNLQDAKHRMVVSLTPEQPIRGRALLSHMIEPFLSDVSPELLRSHTLYSASNAIAQTFLELGYQVDVISYRNDTFEPSKPYTLFADTRFNFERLVPLLDPGCVKLLLGETAHPLFHNAAQSRRLWELYERRGVQLAPKKWETSRQAVSLADFIIHYGNQEFTQWTYEAAGKPMRRFPVSSTQHYEWWDDKNYDQCRNRFLWFGSCALLHKGLDRVLEAFAEMPDMHLTVCGPIQGEPDFERAFSRELYETENIHTVGWVDTGSEAYCDILKRCVGFVYASCSEGQSSAVAECMHAGLIPIVSHESGITIQEDWGYMLRESSVDEIKGRVRQVSEMSADELRRKSRASWEYAREHHTIERFTEGFRQGFVDLMGFDKSEPSANDHVKVVGMTETRTPLTYPGSVPTAIR